jgi:hypothetical protein
MPLDATVGGPDANSFVTVAEADAYFTEHPFGADWIALTDSEAAAYLMLATRVLSVQCWTGIGATAEQALPWPRSGMYAVTGYSLSSTIIPRQLKEMTFELANSIRLNGALTSSSVADEGLKRVKAGPMEIEYFNPMDLERAFSLLTSDIKALGVPSWFCPDRNKVAEFQIL